MSYVTIDEIQSQVDVWTSVLDLLEERKDEHRERLGRKDGDAYLFVGCGSSSYLGACAASVFTHLTETPARAYPASEVYLYPDLVFPSGAPSMIPFLISRSGTTTEVLRAGRTIQERVECPTSGVSCRAESSLVDLVSDPYVLSVADEKSVVMTRSFTSLLLLLQWLAALSAGNESFHQQLKKVPKVGETLFSGKLDVAEQIIEDGDYSNFVFLGQGPYYGLARESALKVKEMSLTHSDAYHSLEFRHGPRSLTDERMLVTFFISETTKESEVKLLEEMADLGATVLAVCETSSSRIDESADYVLPVRSGLDDVARSALYLPVIQLLGYHNAIKKGINPDEPANLTQVVEL